MRLPRVTAKQLIRVLQTRGFIVTRQTGSHAHGEYPQSRTFITVPIHSGKIIGPGLLKSILRQLNLAADELEWQVSALCIVATATDY